MGMALKGDKLAIATKTEVLGAALGRVLFRMVKKHSTPQVTDTSQVLEKVRVHKSS